jgi:hypothetical protein
VPVQRGGDVVGRAVGDDRVDEPVRAGFGEVVVAEPRPTHTSTSPFPPFGEEGVDPQV